MKEYIAIFQFNGEIINLEFTSNSITQEKLISEAKIWINDYIESNYGTSLYHFIKVIPK